MRTFTKNSFIRLGGASMRSRVLSALLASLVLALASSTPAQTFTNLYSFTTVSTNASGVYTNSDGANPSSFFGLILSGNTLYGSALYGGSSGNGTVFAIHTDGSGFTNLHDFRGPDGSGPRELILSGNTLYGTAGGGSSGAGTVFKINTDGTGFTNLYSFTAVSPPYSYTGTNGDGAGPLGLILSGNALYGTASQGGGYGWGTVFALQTDGSGFTNLYAFAGGGGGDGGNPSGVILAGNTLYGTTYMRGGYDWGTVFAIQTDGTSFTNLHDFTGVEGGQPNGGLILSGNTLYGTTYQGGQIGGIDTDEGVVFAIHTDGSGFTNLYSFTPLTPPYTADTNSDGRWPEAGPILWGNALYGTASEGGGSGNGTVFKVNIDGSGFSNLHSFTAGSGSFPNITNSDGLNPYAGLILSGNTLYGTTFYGGSEGYGTVFSITLPRLSPLTNYNFALNGGFETGDLSDWQLTGNSSPDTLIGTKSWYVHSGSYGAQCGPVGSLVYLSQTLPTYPGATYLLSFWLDSPDGETPNEFLVSWNGATLLDKTNLPAIGWTNLQFAVTAAGINSVLQFGFRDDNAYLGLDDIRVTRMVQPASTGISLSGTNLVINGNNGLFGVTYHTLMGTNLAQPLNQWVPVATNVLGVDGNFTITVTNTVKPAVPRRFYILQLQ